jgi:aspartate aminotransferase
VLSAYPDSLVASSFSKTLSIPGERLGYIAVNPACADKALLVAGLVASNRVLGFVNAPALMQRAVTASWRAKADVSRYARRRDMLSSVLEGAGIRFARPEGAFYLFCEAPTSATPLKPGETADIAFAMALKDRGVLSVPGVGFGYPGWFRLCYCVPEATIEGSRAAFASTMESFEYCA